jgi:predicted DNA-binding ribbon-helix-helix protein
MTFIFSSISQFPFSPVSVTWSMMGLYQNICHQEANTLRRTSKTLLGAIVTVGIIGGSITAYAATNTTGATPSNSSASTTTPGLHNRFGGPGGMRGGSDMGGLLQATAKDLNLSAATLRSDLQSGKTIAAIAQAQGVSTATLISELETTMKANLAQAVTSGKMTSAQEQQALSGLDQRVTDFVNGTMPFGGWRGSGGPGGPGGFAGRNGAGNLMTEMAKDLNLSVTTLRSDLQSGKTIPAIAQAQGVSTATLISELETTMKANLAQAVTSGKMTNAKEQQALSGLNQRVTDVVNGTMPFGGRRGPGGTGGPNGCQPGTFRSNGQGQGAPSSSNSANSSNPSNSSSS